MIKNIFLGFNVFLKKTKLLYAFIIYVLFTAYFVFFNWFFEKITADFEIITTDLINYTAFFLNYFKINLLYLIILVFGLLFFLTYLIYIISNFENNKKRTITEDISNVFKFTLLEFIIFLAVSLIFMLLGTFINLITIILMIFFVILIIYLIFLLTIGNVYLGLEKITIRKSLEKSSNFIKKYFWSIIAFFILLYIFYFLTYFVISFIIVELFYINDILAIVFSEAYLLCLSFYLIYALALFIKSKK